MPVAVEDRSDEVVRLPPRRLAAGHLDHGYALTIHEAQGATWDEAFVLGCDRLHREAGHVALTRAREATWLYTVGAEPDEHATHELDPTTWHPSATRSDAATPNPPSADSTRNPPVAASA